MLCTVNTYVMSNMHYNTYSGTGFTSKYEALKLGNPGTADPDITLYYHVSHTSLYAGFEA